MMNFAPSSKSKPSKQQCSNCSSKNPWLLHHVVLRGMDRRLCTSCVLRLHPSSFCPSCFEFFDHPLSCTSSSSAHRFISCIKCSSLTHIQCLPSPPPSHSHSSFLCPPCSSPNFSFFHSPNNSDSFLLDQTLALVLLCAANIASASINKAFSIAKSKADRSVREAAFARKRAKDALHHFAFIHKARHVSSASKDKANTLKAPNPGGLFNNLSSLSLKNGSSLTAKDSGKTNEDKSKNDGKLVIYERLQSSHGTVVDVSSR